jgi:hypothetical protein
LQELAARDEQPQVRRGLDERGELRSSGDQVFDVVEQQQELALADVLGDAVLGTEGLRDRVEHERRIAQRGEPDPEHAIPMLGHELRCGLDREPRLAATAGAGQRHEACPISH